MVPNQKTSNATKFTETDTNKQSPVAVNKTKMASVNQTALASNLKSEQDSQKNTSTVKISKIVAPITRTQSK